MTSLIKNIFIYENEKDVLDSLRRQGINTKVFENKLAGLFNRVYNNYVGYYIFRQDEIIYKLIILPKTIKVDDNTEKNFVNYLLHYYRINSVYDLNKEHNIPDSLLALAFEKNNDEKNSHLPLDDFEFYKYKSILLNIEQFFKRHKNYKRINVDHISQTIKYKLNLKKNIKELDKTNIHQSQTKDILYSLIASVTFNALKLFLTHRIAQLTFDDKKSLQSLASRIINDIEKKYAIDKSYKLSLAKLNSFQTVKIFRSTTETKQLLVNIKTLFGFEHMYGDDVLSIESRFDLQTSSFFIDPIYFYEWYVYDILKSYAEKENKCILFDKEDGTTTKYLISNINDEFKRRSNPDYIIIDEIKKEKIIIDAKWKHVNTLSNLDQADYLKLELDTVLQQNKYTTTSALIYPSLSPVLKNTTMSVNLKEKSPFNFNVLEIDMNFDKDKNSLDFSFDSTIISQTIEKMTHTEGLKHQSALLSNNINAHRTKILANLLEDNNIENKEDTLSQLDAHLLKSSQELYSALDDENLQDEIKEILETYKNILEDESKKFLKSSSSIYQYYRDKNYTYFDYSMPGSGLWKLIELELNASFVWYLRYKQGVCGKDSYEIPLLKIDMGRSIQWVKLNQHDKSTGHLKGLMFGEIKFLSANEVAKEYFTDTYILNELTSFLERIITIRNEHAHVKAMSVEIYEELNNLLFGDKKNLVQILNFKSFIKEQLKEI